MSIGTLVGAFILILIVYVLSGIKHIKIITKEEKAIVQKKKSDESSYRSELEDCVRCFFDVQSKLCIMSLKGASYSEWLDLIPFCEFCDKWYKDDTGVDPPFSLRKFVVDKCLEALAKGK